MALDATVALIALADAKAFLKITGATEDAIVADFINEVSQWISNFCGHPLLTDDYTEYYDGNGTPELILRNFPVTAVASVHMDATRAWAATTAIDVATNVMIDVGAGILRLWNQGGVFWRGHGNIRVIYTAGYASLAVIPYPIQLSARKMVAFLYRTSYAMPKIGVTTETIGDRTTTYFNEAILKDVEAMLKPYQVIGGGGPGFGGPT